MSKSFLEFIQDHPRLLKFAALCGLPLAATAYGWPHDFALKHATNPCMYFYISRGNDSYAFDYDGFANALTSNGFQLLDQLPAMACRYVSLICDFPWRDVEGLKLYECGIPVAEISSDLSDMAWRFCLYLSERAISAAASSGKAAVEVSSIALQTVTDNSPSLKTILLATAAGVLAVGGFLGVRYWFKNHAQPAPPQAPAQNPRPQP